MRGWATGHIEVDGEVEVVVEEAGVAVEIKGIEVEGSERVVVLGQVQVRSTRSVTVPPLLCRSIRRADIPTSSTPARPRMGRHITTRNSSRTHGPRSRGRDELLPRHTELSIRFRPLHDQPVTPRPKRLFKLYLPYRSIDEAIQTQYSTSWQAPRPFPVSISVHHDIENVLP